MESWGPFGPPPKSWDNDPFGAKADPFTPAKSGKAQPQDPWASVPDSWAPVPRASATGAAPRRGDTGQFRVWPGPQRQAPPAHGGYQQDPWGSYNAPPRPPLPPAQRPGYVDPWGGQPVGPAAGYQVPAPAPAPAPKSRALPAILIGSAAVVVVLVLVAAGVLVVIKQQSTSHANGPVSPTSAIPTTELTSTPSYSATTTTTSATPTVLPTPAGPAALGQNPLYTDFDAGLPKQPCNPVGWPSDVPAADTFFQSILPCLDAAWSPLLKSVRMGFHSASVLVPGGTSITTPCGTMRSGFAAFYCSSNETIYMPIQTIQVDLYGNQPFVYLGVFAHEFGHHVQNLSGTFGEAHKEIRDAGANSDLGLELSRRIELQAQCFSGMFSGSVVDSGGMFHQSDLDSASDTVGYRGDEPGGPRDHGTKAHGEGWWNQGAHDNKIGQCNTWLAPSDDVS